MYHVLKNSLAYHKARPMIVPRDVSKAAVGDVSKAMIAYETHAGEVKPEGQAILFYMLNDAFAKLCAKYDLNEPLPPQADHVASLYVSTGQNIAKRALYYTLLIITREARHLLSGQYKHGIEAKHGKVFANFINSIAAVDEDDAVNMLRHNPPKMGIGDYVAGIADVFENGSFHSSYGGKPWANIANTLLRCVRGETSVETFLDTVWTLCHNGGPIFNKGMLYGHYNMSALTKILDVQRAGMIPQYVAEGSPFVDAEIKLAHNQAREVLGDDFAGYVDWFKVEKLGAKGHYHAEKEAQKKKYGESVVMKEAVEAEKNKFYVAPGVAVKIVKRAA